MVLPRVESYSVLPRAESYSVLPRVELPCRFDCCVGMHIVYVPSYYSCINLILFILMLVANVQYYVHSVSLFSLFFAAPSACGIVDKSVGPHESSRILFELTLCAARLEMLIHKHSVIHHRKSLNYFCPRRCLGDMSCGCLPSHKNITFLCKRKNERKKRKKGFTYPLHTQSPNL